LKFNFRLESILKLRKQVENQKQRDYLFAKADVDKCLNEIQAMYQEIADSRQMVHQKQRPGEAGQISSMEMAHEFILGQNVKIERRRQEARELMQVAEQKLEALQKAMVERKAIEKLREREHVKFKKDQKRKEALFFDDISIMRSGRTDS